MIIRLFRIPVSIPDARIFVRSGYYVFFHQVCESRIRGGQNFSQIRTGDMPLAGRADQSPNIEELLRECA